MESEPVSKLLMQKLADIFHGRVFQEFIPGAVVIQRERFPESAFHVGKIHDHAVPDIAFSDKFDFIGMPVNRSASGVIWEEVRTVDVLNNADFHAARRE